MAPYLRTAFPELVEGLSFFVPAPNKRGQAFDKLRQDGFWERRLAHLRRTPACTGRQLFAFSNTPGHPRRMAQPNIQEAEIDKIARVMAAGAGVVWDRLDHYPGYLRGYWRNEARALLGRLAAGELDFVA